MSQDEGPEVISLAREQRRRSQVTELEAERDKLRARVTELELQVAPTSLDAVKADHELCCRHHEVMVHETRGVVTCKHCNTELDPIQVLMWYARRERQFAYTSEMAKAEQTRLQREVEARKRELANLKGKIRRLTARCGDDD